ncbi:MAG: hypothetical protein J6Y30_00840 [Treponema sp.]|nr:hypothetical protein [Treponema sp.]
MKRRKPVILNKGDVIKTNPQKGYWGCAIVLDVQEHNDEFQPLCLVAVTDFVSREDFSFEQVPIEKLSILNIDRSVRVGKGIYCDDGKEICIEIHCRKMNSGQEVIACIDSFPFELPEITYKVGYGKGDGYPLCGPITEGLGFQAVIAWRKANEKEAFMLDVEGTRQITENVLRR